MGSFGSGLLQSKTNKRINGQLRNLARLSFSSAPSKASAKKNPDTKTTKDTTNHNPSLEKTSEGQVAAEEPKKKFWQNNKLYLMYKQYGKTALLTFFGVYVAGFVTLTTVPLLIPSYEPSVALEWLDGKGVIPEQLKTTFRHVIETYPSIGEPIKKYPVFFTNVLAGYMLNEMSTIPRIAISLALIKKFATKKVDEKASVEDAKKQQTKL